MLYAIEEHVYHQQALLRLQDAWAMLKDSEQRVVKLRVEGLTLCAIGERVGLSGTRVRDILNQARRRLYQRLRMRLFEHDIQRRERKQQQRWAKQATAWRAKWDAETAVARVRREQKEEATRAHAEANRGYLGVVNRASPALQKALRSAYEKYADGMTFHIFLTTLCHAYVKSISQEKYNRLYMRYMLQEQSEKGFHRIFWAALKEEADGQAG